MYSRFYEKFYTDCSVFLDKSLTGGAKCYNCRKKIVIYNTNSNFPHRNPLKRSSKIKYLYNEEKLDIKQIFSKEKKRQGRSSYLLSVKVKADSVNAKVVCVKNRNNRKDWMR